MNWNLKGNLQKYSVGALMYSPATNSKTAKKVIRRQESPQNELKYLDSLVFCLEDAITLASVGFAELSLVKSLQQIDIALNEGKVKKLPLLFVRVRNSEQLSRLIFELGNLRELLTGFVLPKYDSSNCNKYVTILQEFNTMRKRPFYVMPVLETHSIISTDTRLEELEKIKRSLKQINPYVLNVRVGGNDFCGLYGLRRSTEQTVYDIVLVRSILEDILNLFSLDYVVSAPVWEYFGSDKKAAWAKGLERELALDTLNGFLGKTAIHPSQLELIHKSLQVDKHDYKDAKSILDWKDSELGVAKSNEGTRMNEVATHRKWAEKIVTLAELYGVKESSDR
jgi:citrate lyase beta subunit